MKVNTKIRAGGSTDRCGNPVKNPPGGILQAQ
jgi:hypothetical protein